MAAKPLPLSNQKLMLKMAMSEWKMEDSGHITSHLWTLDNTLIRRTILISYATKVRLARMQKSQQSKTNRLNLFC